MKRGEDGEEVLFTSLMGSTTTTYLPPNSTHTEPQPDAYLYLSLIGADCTLQASAAPLSHFLALRLASCS